VPANHNWCAPVGESTPPVVLTNAAAAAAAAAAAFRGKLPPGRIACVACHKSKTKCLDFDPLKPGAACARCVRQRVPCEFNRQRLKCGAKPSLRRLTLEPVGGSALPDVFGAHIHAADQGEFEDMCAWIARTAPPSAAPRTALVAPTSRPSPWAQPFANQPHRMGIPADRATARSIAPAPVAATAADVGMNVGYAAHAAACAVAASAAAREAAANAEARLTWSCAFAEREGASSAVPTAFFNEVTPPVTPA
jgi:hypothetical protein